jgi:hypothetical protein
MWIPTGDVKRKVGRPGRVDAIFVSLFFFFGMEFSGKLLGF